MELKHNMIGWIEIPVIEMDRAVKFYENVFEVQLSKVQMGDIEMAMFPHIENSIGASGTLVKHEHYKPSLDGVVIYFTAISGDINIELSRVEAAGGKVIMPRTLITEEIGYWALFIDSEGNKVALHSRK